MDPGLPITLDTTNKTNLTSTITTTPSSTIPSKTITTTQTFAFQAMAAALPNSNGQSNPLYQQQSPQPLVYHNMSQINNSNQQQPQPIKDHEIQKLEMHCKRIYESSDQKERQESEQVILEFGNSPDCSAVCQVLIDRADSPYSQLIGVQTLVKIVTKQSSNLTLDQKIQIRNYSINYLANRQSLEPFVIQSFTKLFAQITKLVWFDVSDTQEVIPLLNQHFLRQDSIERQIVGLYILNQLVSEINLINSDPIIHRSVTRQRRVATNFRDEHLSEIFDISCSILHNSLNHPQTNERIKLIEVSLKLAVSCLSFDFIGTSPDEANSDDLPTVQIPSSWRKYITEKDTLQLFFRLYHSLPPEIAGYSISVLVQLTSVRRSIFSNVERYSFLERMVEGVDGIMKNPSNLSDSSTYHEFCRLLVRFKSNFQLAELAKATNYKTWIVNVREFTCHTFQSWNSNQNSIHYLLMLWQKLVSSSTYCKGSFEHHLDDHAPQVFRAYVTYRLEGCNKVVQEGADDQLDDVIMLQQQMDHLSHISRQKFRDNALFLIPIFKESAERYAEIMRMQINAPQAQLEVLELRLTWLVHIIAAGINGRLYMRGERDDEMEGELISLVMHLSRASDNQLQFNRFRCEKLELAFLSFYDVFRRCHACEANGKMHKRLIESLQLSDETLLYSLYLQKIITNLNYWGSSEPVIKSTLAIFHEMSQTYTTMSKLTELEELKFIMSNPVFPSLRNSVSIEMMKHRTSFHSSIAKHLIESMRLSSEEKFDEFMMPFDKSFEQLRLAIVENQDPAIAQNEDAKRAFIGICRDVRGITKEFVKPQHYQLIYEWLYPKYTPVIRRAIEIWYNEPHVTTPALRLFGELIDNRERRVYHELTSHETIYLFREVSSLAVGFGARLLTLTDIRPDNLWQYKLKPISLVFKLIQVSLRAKINFAVFQLYGDPALNDLLQMFIKLFLSVIECQIPAYPKLGQQYFPLLEVLSSNHSDFVMNLDHEILSSLLSTLIEGIYSTDDRLTSSSFITVHNIVSQLFRWLTKTPRKIGSIERCKEDDEKKMLAACLMEKHKLLFKSILAIMLDLLMTSEVVSHPQLPGPLLVLILLYEEEYQSLRNRVLETQPEGKRGVVTRWFNDLMDGITRNLSENNRDKFTQNALAFRREVNEGAKTNIILCSLTPINIQY